MSDAPKGADAANGKSAEKKKFEVKKVRFEKHAKIKTAVLTSAVERCRALGLGHCR